MCLPLENGPEMKFYFTDHQDYTKQLPRLGQSRAKKAHILKLAWVFKSSRVVSWQDLSWMSELWQIPSRPFLKMAGLSP